MPILSPGTDNLFFLNQWNQVKNSSQKKVIGERADVLAAAKEADMLLTRNFINLCKISFNKRYLLHTYFAYP